MKRFVDTDRFQLPWYMELTTAMKLAYEYIWSRADISGVWIFNPRLGDFQVGAKVEWTKLQEILEKEGRLQVLPGNRWWLTEFITFQCGKLSADCRPHQKVIELMKAHGIEHEGTRPAASFQISPTKRAEIYLRDGGKCVYCGSKGPLTVDHIVPRSKGGGSEFSNLLTCCTSCNVRKCDSSFEDFVLTCESPDRLLEYVDSLSAGVGKSSLLPFNTITVQEQGTGPVQKGEVQEGIKPEVEILEYLNTATGGKYRPVETNLDLIRCRMKEPGVTADGVKLMIDRQIKLWKGTEYEQYLAPTTLFRKEKFPKYYDQREMKVNGTGQRNGEYQEQIDIEKFTFRA